MHKKKKRKKQIRLADGMCVLTDWEAPAQVTAMSGKCAGIFGRDNQIISLTGGVPFYNYAPKESRK